MADPDPPLPPDDEAPDDDAAAGGLDEVAYPIGPDEVTGGLFDRSSPERTGEFTATAGRAGAAAPTRRTALLAWLAADHPAGEDDGRSRGEVSDIGVQPTPEARRDALRAHLRQLWAEEPPDPLPAPDALGPGDFDLARRAQAPSIESQPLPPPLPVANPPTLPEPPTEEVASEEIDAFDRVVDEVDAARRKVTTLPITPFLPPPRHPSAAGDFDTTAAHELADPNTRPPPVDPYGADDEPPTTPAPSPPDLGEASVTRPLPPEVMAAVRARSRDTMIPPPPEPPPPSAIRGLDLLLLLVVAGLVAAYFLRGPA